jgi:restriction endonuclease
MSFVKKLSLFSLILLLLLSISHDLSKNMEQGAEATNSEINQNTEIATIKVQHGDTLLSIVEEINDLNQLHVEEIIKDFQNLNPDSDYRTLIPNTFYYFPLYND